MAFNIPNQTTYTQVRPTTQLQPWTRPAGWISITDSPGIVQFLVSDIGAAYYALETQFTRSGSGNIYINWGDGITDTISTTTSTITQHNYTSGGTASGLGYDTWKITISGDVDTTITQVRQRRPIRFSGSSSNQFVSGVLEEYYGDNTCQLGFLSHRQYIPQPFLQYSKLPSVMTGGTTILSNVYGDGANSCPSLRVAVMPTSAPNATDLQRTFWGCNNLTSVSIPLDMTGITTMALTFFDCWSLYEVSLPTLNELTTLSQTFQNCRSLEDIEFLPELPKCLTYASSFNGCVNIRTAKLKKFPTALNQFIIFNNAFTDCRSLEYVNLPALANTGSTLSMSASFQNCFNLKSFQAPLNFNTDTLQNAFNGCSSLQSCIFPSTIPSLTTFQSTFQNCYSIPSFTFPTPSPTGINMTSMFQGATSISEIYVPDTYNNLINAVVNMCNGATSLRKLRFPPISQVQNFGNLAPNATNLVEVILPTTANGISGFNGAFSNCSSLTGATIPNSTSGAINFGGAFSNCIALEQITFPSTFRMTTMASSFQNCRKLKNIVMPSTTGLITSYASAFQGCSSLESITLPTFSSTTLTTMNAMCSECSSLTGITNTISLGNTSTAATTYIDGTNAFFGCQSLQSISLYNKFSKLNINSSYPTDTTSIRLFNTGSGQFAGSSQQLQVQYNNMDRTAIVQLFTDLPSVVATKVINVANNPGTSSLTAGDIAIATGKGWSVVVV